MTRQRAFVSIVVIILAYSTVAAANKPPARAPLFEGLGNHTWKVTTNSAEAQRYFNQGLAFLYAFNHDEAKRAFRQAAELDPRCAMAWWGLAYAQGPHINLPIVSPESVKEAVSSVAEARKVVAAGTDVEQALIAAVAKRYVDPQPEDRKPLDEAYAAAMGDVRKRFPEHADVGALYAESLMDLHPWDLWLTDGTPQPWTPQILEVLEGVLKAAPNHPLAMHLYIHACEASPTPGKADDVANRLRTAAPGLGHLVHMPSHIDIRRGRWQQAAETNERAIEADGSYVQQAPQQGFYRLYMSHNHHMLAFAAIMQGQHQRSSEAIGAMLAAIPAEWLAVEANAAIADGFFAMPFEVAMRFGRWQELIDSEEPDAKFPIARALRHQARAVAFGAQGKLKDARAEQQAFQAAVKLVPEEAAFGNNKAADLFVVADRLLEGELLLHEGQQKAGLAALRSAVEKEDTLRYDEPPDWIQPVRHALGAALLRAKQPVEAEAVYREDLRRWPDNGWSLFGLSESLTAQNKPDEAKKVRKRFQEIWQHADVKLTASCFCQAKGS